MNWLDITLLCLAGLGLMKGLFDGVIKQVVSLIALIVGIYFCGEAAAWLEEYIVATGWFPAESVTVLSYLAGFLLVVGLLLLVGEVIHRIIGVTPLSLLNHLLGGLFGLALSTLFLSLLLNVLEYVDRNGVFMSREAKLESRLYYGIKEIIPTIYPKNLFSERE